MRLLYIHDIPITAQKANIIQVLHMCDAFSKLGISVSLAIPNEGETKEFILERITGILHKKIAFSIVPYNKISLLGRFSMVGGYFGINKVLARTSADYCFVRNPIYLNATKKRSLPTIFESHSSWLHNRYKTLDEFWKKNLIKNSKSKHLIRFICISNALAEIWKRRGVPYNKLMILHDGVDHETFSRQKDFLSVRKILNLPIDKKIVMYVGSLYTDRGIENILNLARIFKKVIFVVIGGPEERKNFYIRESTKLNIDNIMFLGYIQNHRITDYLSSADVLLMIWTDKVKTINFCSPISLILAHLDQPFPNDMPVHYLVSEYVEHLL